MINKILKSSLVIIVLLAISISSFAQNPFSPFNDAKPKGKIDTVIIISGNANWKYVYVYNKHRQLVETTWYRSEVFPDGIGRVFDTVKTVFTYGANRRLISSFMIFKRGKRSTARYEYLPTKYGYAIRTIDSRDKDSSLVNEMRFDHLGRVIQYGSYALKDLEKQREGNFEYQYDGIGNMIKSTAHYNLVWASKVFYKYNSDGDMIALSRENLEDPRNSSYTYPKYDQMHNWTERKFLNGNGFEHTDQRRITYYK
ncbi:MAG: hypothetical protein V4560_18080 [Bacteroidota bacterium]